MSTVNAHTLLSAWSMDRLVDLPTLDWVVCSRCGFCTHWDDRPKIWCPIQFLWLRCKVRYGKNNIRIYACSPLHLHVVGKCVLPRGPKHLKSARQPRRQATTGPDPDAPSDRGQALRNAWIGRKEDLSLRCQLHMQTWNEVDRACFRNFSLWSW